MEAAIARKNVGSLRTLAAAPGAAETINRQFLLHKVIKLADQVGEETPQIVEMFRILAEVPGVQLGLSQQAPTTTNAHAYAVGAFGTPLQLALSKGLPEIAYFLVKSLGLSVQEELPVVEMSLFQWSILRNKQELFFRLLDDPEFDATAEAANVQTLKLAIQSLRPVYIETILDRWTVDLNVGDTYDNLFTFAIEKGRLGIADRMLKYPGLDLVEAFVKLVRLNMNRTDVAYLHKIAAMLTLDQLEAAKNRVRSHPVAQQVKPPVIALLDAEIAGRTESLRGFANVVNARGLPRDILYPVGEFLGLGAKTRRVARSKRSRRARRARKSRRSRQS